MVKFVCRRVFTDWTTNKKQNEILDHIFLNIAITAPFCLDAYTCFVAGLCGHERILEIGKYSQLEFEA